MVAWLITWEDVNNKVEIAAVLNHRTSPKTIIKIVKLLYANNKYSLSERLKCAQNNKHNPYPAKFDSINGVPWEGRITCGDNPWLYARIADNLRIAIDIEGDETLKWDERPVPKSII